MLSWATANKANAVWTEARKNLPQKNPCGEKNVQEIWVGTKAQAPNDLKPILRRLYKNEIRTADPTRMDAWYLRKKELNKEKY